MGEDSPNRIRILLQEESGLFRSSLARFLAAEAGFEITGECESVEEALKDLTVSPVHVALLDFDAGLHRGCGFLTAAREAGYTGQFVIVTERVDAASAAMALKLGANGIFLKSEAPERHTHAIRMVAATPLAGNSKRSVLETLILSGGCGSCAAIASEATASAASIRNM